MNSSARKRHLARGGILIIIAGLLLVAYAVRYGIGRYQAIREKVGESQVTTLVTTSVDNPGEATIEKNFNPTVPADQPRRLIIPVLKVDAFVQPMAIDQHGNIAVPTNINLAGWYTGSAKPGDLGISIIDGHVTGRYRDGIFKHLHELKAGDEFEVEMGDLSLKKFRVVNMEDVPLADAADAMVEQVEGVESQVTLITCSGTYSESQSTYERRVIVRAELIS